MCLIEPFRIPQKGIWDVVGLSRAQFFIILVVSIGLFLFIGGPAWSSLRNSHTLRILGSYLAIPVLVLAAQWKNGAMGFRPWVEASMLLALIKLMATAILFIGVALLC